MAESDDQFWRLFDEVDRQRRRLSRQREDAFRRLDPAPGRQAAAEALALWQEYCNSIEKLDESIAELERMVWRLK